MLLSAQGGIGHGRWAFRLSVVWLGILFSLALGGAWLLDMMNLPAANDLDHSCIGGCAPLAGGNTLHLLGTDALGRDVLSQLIGGTRTAILGGLAASGLSFFIGFVLGACSAWFSKSGQRLSWLVLAEAGLLGICLLYTSPSPRDRTRSRMPSSA